jgi:prepilin-type N-terminal cleavage/methylation domain-containing protein
MRLRRDERARDDRGVTLTEVLVTIIILGVIGMPLGNALIGFIRHTDDTTRRLSESHDIQIAAAYFAQDVQSVGARDWTSFPYPLRQSIEPDAPAAGGLYPCGTPGLPAAVVRLAWDDPQSASGTPEVVRVSYVVVTDGAERQLRRVTCVGSATPVSDLVLAHNVDEADPVLACSSPCGAAPGVPQAVTLTLSIKNPDSDGPALSVELAGQRRQT